MLRAFGGGVLKGDNFVKWVYLDEAGSSAKERLVTVAGVVVDADKHHRALKGRLDQIRDDLPEELRVDLIFHAKDIWHGNKQFDREKWDAHGIQKDERRSLVEQICSIPEEFGLPVIYGQVAKEQHFSNWQIMLKNMDNRKLTPNRLSYALAFGQCAIAAEAFIRDYCPEDEVGQIVAEDTEEMREHADWAYSVLEQRDAPWLREFSSYVPLERLNEGPQFAKKKRSPILQIADSIAFVMNRHDSKGTFDSDVGHCYDKFKDQIPFPRNWSDFGSDF